MIACQNSGYDVLQCFREVTKTSKRPNGGVKQVIDYLMRHCFSAGGV
jgi:hypothetical protein